MINRKVKVFVFILAVFLPTVVLFSNTQASFLDIIRALVTINPLEVEVSAPSFVETNRVFKVEAVVKNKGEERVMQTNAEIFLSEGLVLLKKNTTQNAGTILGEREKVIQWSAKAEQAGNYGISVVVSGSVQGSTIFAQGSTVIVTVQDTAVSSSQTNDFFQGLLNTIQRWLRF